jgi:hypothetical protein
MIGEGHTTAEREWSNNQITLFESLDSFSDFNNLPKQLMSESESSRGSFCSSVKV